jgi:hypothetical protein
VGAKMVANKFKNKNPPQPMRRCNMLPIGPGFYSFGRGGM